MKNIIFRSPQFAKILKFSILLFLIALIVCGSFFFFIATQNRSIFIHNPIVREFLPVYRVAKNITKKMSNMLYLPYMSFDTTSIENYELYIDPEDIATLNSVLPDSTSIEVLQGNVWLTEEQKETVPATFVHNGKQYKVEVRYRGDNPVHWLNPKKSWQIKFDKDNLFKGHRVLKLIIPKDRSYFVEPLNNYRAEKLGLNFPPSEFISLSINGKHMGPYLQIIDWGNEFLELNELPADANVYKTEDVFIMQNDLSEKGGTIFDLTRFWNQEAGDKRYEYDNYAELGILLRKMREGTLGEYVDTLVDLDSFYSWNIFYILSGSTHAGNDGNVRLYFNNTSGKFEFIPWDAGLDYFSLDEVSITSEIAKQILSNEVYLLERDRRLWAYIDDKDNIEDDLDYYDDLYDRYRGLFYADLKKKDSNFEFDAFYKEKREHILQNIKNIKDTFKTENTRLKVRLNEESQILELQFFVKDQGGIKLSDLEVPSEGVSVATLYHDINHNRVFDQDDKKLGESVVKNGKITFAGDLVNLVHRLSIHRDPFTDESLQTLFILYESREDAELHIADIDFKSRNAVTNKKIDIDDVITSNVSTFNFLEEAKKDIDAFIKINPQFQKRGDSLYLPPGRHVFTDLVVIPFDTSLVVAAGARLLMEKDISILSYSPVHFQGTPQQKIVVEGAGEAPWGVFGVVNTGDVANVIEYTDFVGGGEDYINGIFMSGMLSVYHGNLELKRSGIVRTTGEDGVNVKYGEVYISDTLFDGNVSDALDVDYSTGQIVHNTFVNSGNDAIDTSGSKVFIAGNKVSDSGDKCISLGERTTDTLVYSNKLTRCNIGIEVKDGSTPTILNNYITQNQIGVNAYMKKPIYETGGHTIVLNTLFVDNEIGTTEDMYSEIQISGSLFNPIDVPGTRFCVTEYTFTSTNLVTKEINRFSDWITSYVGEDDGRDDMRVGLIDC